MPHKEADPFAADTGAVAAFIAANQTVDEQVTSENKRVATRMKGWDSKASGSKVDPKQRHTLSESVVSLIHPDGRQVQLSRSVTVTSFDKKGNIKGFFITGTFATLTKNGEKDGVGCSENVYQPPCAVASTTVTASDGVYKNWNDAEVEVTYAGSGINAKLKGIKLIG
jgi:hypothetical protein